MYEHKIEVAREDGDGTEWVTLQFKPMAEVPIGVLRRNRHDQESQMWETFEWALGDQIDVFDRLPSAEIEKIMADWQKDNGQGVAVGESSASPKSSTATARRSKPTSSD